MLDTLEVDYLYKSQEEWQKLGDYLDDPFFNRLYQETRQAYTALQEQRGERVIDVPHYLNDPRRAVNNPIPNRIIKNIVERAAVLWFIDKKEEDLEYLWEALRYFIEHGIFSCTSRRHGGHDLHADLETADASYICGFVLDTFQAVIPDDIREGLIDKLRNDTLPAYLDGVRKGDWWRYANFNWGAALHGCSGLGALALWNIDKAFAQTVIKEALNGLQFLWDALPDGGFCTEGQMYQTTTMCHLAEFLMPWYRLTNDDLGFLNNHFVEMSVDFHMHMQGGDGGALNFSNMNANTTERGGPHFYWWAYQYQRPEWSSYEDQVSRPWSDTHGVFFNVAAFWYAQPQQERQKVALKSVFHFPGLDWLNFHKGEMWGAVRAGYNAHNHNHKSLGHFILGYGSDRFLISPGYGAGQTQESNTITVGPQVEAARAPIIRIRNWDDGFWAVCDLQPAYANRVDVCFRHYLLVANKHFIIIDHIIGKNGKRPNLQWYLQSYMNPQEDGDALQLIGKEHKLHIQHLSVASPYACHEWDFKSKPIQRIKWHDPIDQVASVHAMVLSVDKPDCTWKEDGRVADLTIDGDTYSLNLFDHILTLPD